MSLHDTPIYRKDWNDTEFSPGKGVFIVSMSILNVFMLLGNAMSMVTIVKSPSLRKRASYWFVMNLAFTDTMIAVTIVPLNIVWEFYGPWPLGTSACKFITFADNSFSTVSAYSIVLVSIDKYIYITDAIHYHHRMTKTLAVILIIGVWICVTVFSCVSIFTGILESHFAEEEGNCIFFMKDSHAVAAAVISFFFPLVVLCFTTSRIFCIANRHLCRIHATPSFSYTDGGSRQSTGEENVSTKITKLSLMSKRNSIAVIPVRNNGTVFSKASSNETKQQNTSSMEDQNIKYENNVKVNKQSESNQSENMGHHRKLKSRNSCPEFQQRNSKPRNQGTKRLFCKLFGTVTIVIFFFILMFAPLYITLMIDVVCHCVKPWLYEDVLAVLCRSHALVNPYIYIVTDRKYKAAFSKVWKKRCRISAAKTNDLN